MRDFASYPVGLVVIEWSFGTLNVTLLGVI